MYNFYIVSHALVGFHKWKPVVDKLAIIVKVYAVLECIQSYVRYSIDFIDFLNLKRVVYITTIMRIV